MDALGQEIQSGDIVLFTRQKKSGFLVAVVSQLGGNRVKLIGGRDSRKDKENLIILTEEQYISMQSRSIHINEDGMVENRVWQQREDGPGHEMITIIVTPEERLLEITRQILMLSRTIKGEELGEYEPTDFEVERFKL